LHLFSETYGYSVFVLVPCCFCYYGSVVQFEVRHCVCSSIAFSAQDCFGYLGSFVLPYEF
jgi:hypothetical protein